MWSSQTSANGALIKLHTETTKSISSPFMQKSIYVNVYTYNICIYKHTHIYNIYIYKCFLYQNMNNYACKISKHLHLSAALPSRSSSRHGRPVHRSPCHQALLSASCGNAEGFEGFMGRASLFRRIWSWIMHVFPFPCWCFWMCVDVKGCFLVFNMIFTYPLVI